MPRRNTRKTRRRLGFHHVYNRTKDGSPMFLDDADKRKFLEILERYLVPADRHDRSGRLFRKLFSRVRLITFALMINHFHLILFQFVPEGIEDLMQRVITAYVKYFNLRHGRSGEMFNGEFRLDHKPDRRSQLTAIAYVHDNHGDDCRCEFCGSRYFDGHPDDWPMWLDVGRGLALFGGRSEYREFRESRQILRDVTASAQSSPTG